MYSRFFHEFCHRLVTVTARAGSLSYEINGMTFEVCQFYNS